MTMVNAERTQRIKEIMDKIEEKDTVKGPSVELIMATLQQMCELHGKDGAEAERIINFVHNFSLGALAMAQMEHEAQNEMMCLCRTLFNAQDPVDLVCVILVIWNKMDDGLAKADAKFNFGLSPMCPKGEQ